MIDEVSIDSLLSNNYPNPFNPSTKVSWQSPVGSWQTIKIFDLLGQEIANLVNEGKAIGTYEVSWNAANLPSGVYIYKMKAGDPSILRQAQYRLSSGQVFVETRKMVLLK